MLKTRNLSPKLELKPAFIELGQPVGTQTAGERVKNISPFTNILKRSSSEADVPFDLNITFLEPSIKI